MPGGGEAEVAHLKDRVRAAVDAERDVLIELSLRIHAHPEQALEEKQASAWLSGFLEERGFRVERGGYGLPTSFRACYGSGRPVVGLLAEYDALPEVGHACGHNIIGTASVAAGSASRLVVDELGGAVVVYGTPAEEVLGGKAIMAQAGAFAELDAAMLVHPGVRETALIRSLACIGLDVEYHGRAAHAAARPEEGINALEALLQAFNGINSLRQHIKERARIHGVITHGGAAANIVPDFAAGSFLVRAEDDAYLEELKERVLHVFEGAATVTGARLQYRWAAQRYAAMNSNRALASLYAANMETLGRTVQARRAGRGLGSTDMGNVSVITAAIHPSVAIAPRSVLGHSPEFAQAAASERGHRGLLDGAKAMAMTVADLLGDGDALARVRGEFEGGGTRRPVSE